MENISFDLKKINTTIKKKCLYIFIFGLLIKQKKDPLKFSKRFGKNSLFRMRM